MTTGVWKKWQLTEKLLNIENGSDAGKPIYTNLIYFKNLIYFQNY